MTLAIITDIENLLAKLKGSSAIQTVETDAKAIGSATLSFIETNGLQDAYQIALTVVSAALPGASWTGVLASIETQALAAGKQLITGGSAILASMAQADLMAAGKLLPPVSAPIATPAPQAPTV